MFNFCRQQLDQLEKWAEENLSEEDQKLIAKFVERQLNGAQLFAKKHADYGPKPIGEFGFPVVLILLHAKIQRLIQLVQRDYKGYNESIRDTLLDLANYGIIGLLVVDQEWPELHHWQLINRDDEQY